MELNSSTVSNDVSSLDATSTASISLRVPAFTLTNEEKLQELLLQYFPNYGRVEFKCITVSPDSSPDHASSFGVPSGSMMYVDSPASAATPSAGQKRYRCEVCLFGMKFHNSDFYDDWEEAKQIAAGRALAVMQNFVRLVVPSKDDELFNCVIRPLLQEMDSFKHPSAPTLAEGDSTSSIEPVLTPFNKWNSNVQTNLMGPVVTSILDGPAMEPAIEKKKSKLSLPTSATVSTPSVDGNPVNILFEHQQRRAAHLEPPVFEIFSKSIHFGAICSYGGNEIVVPAVYKSKKDAKNEAARLMCLKIFGKHFDSPTIPPSAPVGVASEALRAENLSIARSAPLVQDAAEKIATTASSSSAKISDLAESMKRYQREMPAGPLTAKPLGGQRFVSVINEYCQVTRQMCPNYQFISINASLTNSFCCLVDSFEKNSFMSFAFIKKSDAKEDCAGRIFQLLLEDDKITLNGKPKSNQSSAKDQSASWLAPPMAMPPPLPFIPGIFPLRTQGMMTPPGLSMLLPFRIPTLPSHHGTMSSMIRPPFPVPPEFPSYPTSSVSNVGPVPATSKNIPRKKSTPEMRPSSSPTEITHHAVDPTGRMLPPFNLATGTHNHNFYSGQHSGPSQIGYPQSPHYWRGEEVRHGGTRSKSPGPSRDPRGVHINRDSKLA